MACVDAARAGARARDNFTDLRKEVTVLDRSLTAFFSLVPAADMERVQRLSDALRSLDTGNRRRLTGEELQMVVAGKTSIEQEDAEVVSGNLALQKLFIP